MLSDCAKSGEFNSITSHVFRRRRSAEYSYPDAKPHESRAQKSEPDNRTPAIEKSSHHTHEVPDHSSSHDLSNKMMDAIDSRIEGVETIMIDLKKTVNKLSRKVTTAKYCMDVYSI